MGADIVTTVKAMNLREIKPLLRSTIPLFEWRPGFPINDYEEELDYEVVQKDEPLLEENRAIVAQGNKILHNTGNVNE